MTVIELMSKYPGILGDRAAAEAACLPGNRVVCVYRAPGGDRPRFILAFEVPGGALFFTLSENSVARPVVVPESVLSFDRAGRMIAEESARNIVWSDHEALMRAVEASDTIHPVWSSGLGVIDWRDLKSHNITLQAGWARGYSYKIASPSDAEFSGWEALKTRAVMAVMPVTDGGNSVLGACVALRLPGSLLPGAVLRLSLRELLTLDSVTRSRMPWHSGVTALSWSESKIHAPWPGDPVNVRLWILSELLREKIWIVFEKKPNKEDPWNCNDRITVLERDGSGVWGPAFGTSDECVNLYARDGVPEDVCVSECGPGALDEALIQYKRAMVAEILTRKEQ